MELVQLSTAVVVHGEREGESVEKKPNVVIRGPNNLIQDHRFQPSHFHSSQQIVLQEDVVPSRPNFIAELGRIIQDSQAQNEEKLQEIIRYTHDHVLHTAADTENHLGCHIRDYLIDVHAHYESTVKHQTELLGIEIDRRLNGLDQEVQDHSQASAAAAVKDLANELENKVNGALKTMEAAINLHNTTHMTTFDVKFMSALKKIQDDFEAAVDLQSGCGSSGKGAIF
ncbi:hypothetical protein DVH05_025125 [Phytophthora capsici]|nr:hypothetical protein DVH05_025125 [Phytophthora capsici]